MKLSWLFLLSIARLAFTEPTVTNPNSNVTYQGFIRNGVEVFLGIPYAQDTGSENRFKPPQLFVPVDGSTIEATSYGPACPQALGRPGLYPLYLSNITDISEDCLNLNIARPSGTDDSSKHAVMVWIHGGSFWSGSNADIVAAPDGLVLESIENETPIIHVGVNYRLGAFGFAQSKALYDEQSLNAGLRDQRLATEWVRDNIKYFGGDPESITIFGQSSGGLAVGMQILAYGGTRPLPFQRAICESQSLEPGITGNFTYHQMDLLASALDCTSWPLDSVATLACLRAAPLDAFLNASIETYSGDISSNIGDVWLPVVDGSFLPSSPSDLLRTHAFSPLSSAMIGWCDDDLSFFTPRTITTPNDTAEFIASYLPALTPTSLSTLLSLYPSASFPATPSANLSSEFHRSARLFRDILMVCMPIWTASNLAQSGTQTYLYDQNASVLPHILAGLGSPGLGPVHTSEFAYVFGNLSHYEIEGLDLVVEEGDRRLAKMQARSWASFAVGGGPSSGGGGVLRGWGSAFVGSGAELGAQGEDQSGRARIYVVGGAEEGLAATSEGGDDQEGGSDGGDGWGDWEGKGDGEGDELVRNEALLRQELGERCKFLNSEEVVRQLQF